MGEERGRGNEVGGLRERNGEVGGGEVKLVQKGDVREGERGVL